MSPWTAAHQASLYFTLLEFAQIHVRWVGDAIQPSYPLPAPPPLALNISQHQGLFQWVGSLHQVAKVLELQLQSVLPMNIQDWFPLRLTGWISLLSSEHSRVFSNTTVQKHQFFPSFNSFQMLLIQTASRSSLRYHFAVVLSKQNNSSHRKQELQL